MTVASPPSRTDEPAPVGARLQLSIAVSTHAAQFEAIAYKGDLESQLAEIARLGFDGVELAIRDPAMIVADELVALVDACELSVPAITTGQAYTEEGLWLTSADAAVRRAALARLESHLPLASRLGAVVIVGLMAASSLDGQQPDVASEQLVAGLRSFSASAAAAGVRVALEPVNRYEGRLIRTVHEGLELVARVDAENFGLLLDTFHMNIEEPSAGESIRAAGGRIFHFHVADSNRWYPGAGHIDFSAVLDALAATGYRGFVSGEFLPYPTATAAAERFLATMRTVPVQLQGPGS